MSLRRKLLAGIISIAALCIFAPVTDAKAEDSTNVNTYKVNGAYEVSVPATVTIDSSKNTGKLNISGTLNTYHNLEITITSDTDYRLMNESHTGRGIGYKISDKKIVFSNKDESNPKTLNYDVDVNVTEAPVVSGTYTDILKFELNEKDYTPVTKKHQLKFNGNSSDNDVQISTDYKYVTENEEYGMLPMPKRKGYTFQGWFLNASGDTKIKETDVMGKQDTTVYAHWRANVLTLHYHSGGAQQRQIYPSQDFTTLTEEDVVENETVKYDAKYQHYDWGLLNVSRLKKKGYDPDGDGYWRVGSPESDFMVSAGSNSIESPYTGKKVAEYLKVLDKLEAGDTTVELYPVFHPNQYTVKYEANASDANGTTEPTKHTYDVKSTLAKNGFTRKGYVFDGWGLYPDSDEMAYQESALVSNLTDQKNGIITLYAKWKEIPSSDGSVNDTEVQANQNTSDTLNQKKIDLDEPTADDLTNMNVPAESVESQKSEQPTTETVKGLESEFIEVIEPNELVTETVPQEDVVSD